MPSLEILLVFGNKNKTLVKGENTMESKHVVKVTQNHESDTLQGDIQASHGYRTYAVKVSLLVSISHDLKDIYFLQ